MKRPSLARLLRKWQPLFLLSDWKITAAYRGHVTMSGKPVEAHCTWSRPEMTARIHISEPAFQPTDFDVEAALVHELHHPVLEDWGMTDEGEEFIERNTKLLLRLDRRAD